MFATYFQQKISTIRASLDSSAVSPSDLCAVSEPEQQEGGPRLSEFQPTTAEEIKKIINSKPIKTCSLDPLPRGVLNQCIDCIIPTLVTLINSSFATGLFPLDMKRANIIPLLKKPSLNCELLKNYRPVSNLSQQSKLLERVAAARLHQYFADNDLYPKHQSAYRPVHSVESALLHISDSILCSLDVRLGVVVVLLDLSAAFDTIDHNILLATLHTCFGITGIALQWTRSYLSDRSFKVVVDSQYSSSRPLQYGVPQGSVLGPFLYTA